MENQENKSKWDDLARELGADVRPDEPPSIPPPSTDAAQESYSEPRAADKPRPVPPKRAAANWSQLNVELGLPPVEEPPPPAPSPEAAVTPERIPAPPAERVQRSREDRAREDRPHREDRPRRDREHADRGQRSRGRSQRDQRDQGPSDRDEGERGRGGRGRRGRRGRGGRGQRDRSGEHDRAPSDHGHGDRGRREHGDRGRNDHDREDRPQEWRETQPTFSEADAFEERAALTDETFVAEVPPSPQPPEPPAPPVAEAPPKPSAGVSLWHKIFGSPAEQAAKLTEQAADTERVEIAESIAESTAERETSWSAVDEESRTSLPAEAEPASVDTDAGIEADESREPEEGEPRRRGRSRRRRRGRGGRGGEREPSARRDHHRLDRSDSNRGGDDDFDDLGVEPVDAEVGADRMDSDANGFDADDDLGDSEDIDTTERAADGRGHRAIPSWEDAIGMIVDSNLQSRSQRRQTSHTGRRGGSSRGGRARGGRRPSNPQNGQ